jgi:transcriptional regulator with XRE-family HTH domain
MKKSPRTKPARLAEKLLHIRLALNLSQAEMLARLGFSDELFRSNVSQYERGIRVPPLPVLLEYARAAGVNVEEMIDDDLDLPERLPDAKQSEGIKRSVKR